MNLETLKQQALEIVMNDKRYSGYPEIRQNTLGYLLTHGDAKLQAIALRVLTHYGHIPLEEAVFMTPQEARRFDTGDDIHSDPRKQTGHISIGRQSALGSSGPDSR